MNIGFPQSPISGAASIDAYYTDGHLKFIQDMVKRHNLRIVVEVGSGIGRITECLAENLDLVYAVDLWVQNLDPQVDQRTQQRHHMSFEAFCINCWDFRSKIIPIQGKSDVVMTYLAEKNVKPDALYLDGNHTTKGLRHDIETAQTLFPNAILFGDDFSWNNGITEPINFAVTKSAETGYSAFCTGAEFWELVPNK